MWRVDKAKRILIPDAIGTFDKAHCYIILYSYKRLDNAMVETYIFFWLGSMSSAVDRSAASMISKIMDDSLTDRSIEVKVSEGFEPPVLCSIFPSQRITAVSFSPSTGVSPVLTSSTSDTHSTTKLYEVGCPSANVITYHEVHISHFSSWGANSLKIVDADKALFLWVGSSFVASVRRDPFVYLTHYFESVGIQNDFRPIYKIPGGRETLLFSSTLTAALTPFIEEVSVAMEGMHVEESTSESKQEDFPMTSTNSPPSITTTSSAKPALQKFSYEVLAKGSIDEVDPTRKEAYLEDEVFDGLFGMSKEAFHALPLWRQQAKKKELSLF